MNKNHHSTWDDNSGGSFPGTRAGTAFVRVMRVSLFFGGLLGIAGFATSLSSLHAEESATDESSAEPADPLNEFLASLVDVQALANGEQKEPAVRAAPRQKADSAAVQEESPLPAGFRISRFEVWQDLYQHISGQNPSRWQGQHNSVEQVTWEEAQTFCAQLTQRLRKRELIADDEKVRLPTEAEWEYCCRAGTTTAYSFGDQPQEQGDQRDTARRLDRYAWHAGNAAGNDPAVGALEPNPWGLYDMHGYLWEMTSDCWHPAEAREEPISGTSDACETIAIRGGSWRDRFPKLTSQSRDAWDKTTRGDWVGFRCVLVTEVRDE